jgi:hypothetical protein
MSRVNGPYVIRHGDVWKQNAGPGLVDNGLLHVCDGTGEMAIAYQGDALLKIGGASSVDAWLDANREKLDQMREMLAGMGEDDEDLDLVVLRLPVSQAIVDELNLCIAISGRVARLRENLERIGVDDPSLFDRPRYPS